jgi:Na+/H+-dicarboxylate symporter
MSQPTRILLALVLGLALGVGIAALSPVWAGYLIPVATPIGAAWLNGLQMTIIPLVVALLVMGIAATAEAVRAGRIAAQTIALVLVVLTASATIAAFLTPLLLRLVPMPTESAAALRAALSTGPAPAGAPPIAEFLASVVPTNVFAAAAGSNFLQLIVFTLVFAFALTRIAPEGRATLTNFFSGLRDTTLVMIDWLIWIAPVGVFALALVVGAKTGTAAFGALLHYVATLSSVGIIITLLAYPVAMLGGRVALGRFARAAMPSQAVAVSTQSSLATLPAMLTGAESLGVHVGTSGVVLPLAVVMMRATGPAMNLAVAIYVATWFGVDVGPATMAAAVLVATLTSLGSVSLPGQISFISAIAPIAVTMGVPIAPLGLLVAVETIPDIFRTLGNVTMDLAATLLIAARNPGEDESDADALLRTEAA